MSSSPKSSSGSMLPSSCSPWPCRGMPTKVTALDSTFHDSKHSLGDAFQCILQPTTTLLDCILYLMQHPYDPGTLPSSANWCIFGGVFGSTLSKKGHDTLFWVEYMHAAHSCCTGIATTSLQLQLHAGPSSMTQHVGCVDFMCTAISVLQDVPWVLPRPHACRDKASVNSQVQAHGVPKVCSRVA